MKSVKKIQSTDYETFDQLKNDNFDQVNFGQTTLCQILWHCSKPGVDAMNVHKDCFMSTHKYESRLIL